MLRTINTVVAVVLSGVISFPSMALCQDEELVFRVPVNGVVELGLAPFIERSIRAAQAANASAIVLDIDTPGGRVDAAERIADAIRDSSVPVYAFVNRRAFSAGALICLATKGIYMRPGSVIGAATPVDGGGNKASEKIVSAMRSEMRALAESQGLDPKVAEAMVDESIAIPELIESGKLLTLTTEEAVGLGYGKKTDDFNSLLNDLELSGATVKHMEVNWTERLVRFFSHPIVAPFLLSLGFLGLIAEIKTPTVGLAGLAGLSSLLLFFGSHLILGLAGWEDLLIFGVGALLLTVEALLIPGFGLLGLIGIIGMAVGIYMSLLGSMPTAEDFSKAGGILSSALLLMLIIGWAILRRLPKSTRLYRTGIFLNTRTDKSTGYESAHPRPELVGREGIAITDLRPSGVGVFEDERIDIISESEWVEQGTPIRIVAAEGYRHVVRSLAEDGN